MPKKQFTTKINEGQEDYFEQLTETVGINKLGFAEFAVNLMQTYFTIDQLKSEVIVHGPKDLRRKG